MASKSWDRRERESAQAYEAFLEYLTQPATQRSTEMVAEALSKSGSLIRRWSGAHDWVDRVRAFDGEAERKVAARAQERQIAMIDRAKKRRRKLARLAFDALLDKFEDDKFLASFTPAQAYAIGMLAMKAEDSGLGALNGPPQSIATSGDLSDPLKQGQLPGNQPVQTMLRKLEIEVIGAGGELVPASEIAAAMAQFYDKPGEVK